HPRSPSDRWCHAVRGAGVHPCQSRRRHPVWGHRPAGTPGVIASAARLRMVRLVSPAWLQPLAVVGLVFAGAWLAIALLAPWLSPYDPLDQGGRLYQPPSVEHLFGTDDLGRDVFSRVLWGARVSIPLAVLLVNLAFLIGGALGALAGYLGGWVDELVMRAADLVFAIPTILLAMAVVAALGPGLVHAVMAVG